MTFQHLGAILDEPVELPHRLGVMVLQGHQGIRQDGQPDGRAIQQRSVARNKAFLFQSSQPAPAGGGREADFLGELLVGDAGIPLQGIENASIDAIQGSGPDFRSESAILLPR
jgi:hypothetical protein